LYYFLNSPAILSVIIYVGGDGITDLKVSRIRWVKTQYPEATMVVAPGGKS